MVDSAEEDRKEAGSEVATAAVAAVDLEVTEDLDGIATTKVNSRNTVS